MGFATASATAVLLLWAALIGSEKRVLTTYIDVFGVPTVCAGITGPGVVLGKTYTVDECKALESAYIDGMLKRMGRDQCVSRRDLDLHQVIAWGHFAYNSGDGAAKGFCGSTAARKLNAHDDDGACEEMLRWRFGTDRRTGKKVDCEIRANKCYGLYDRRLREHAMCFGNLDAFKREGAP